MKLSKEKSCELIGRWRKACVRHFYWAVTSTHALLGDVKLAKFQAFLYHVINKHKELPNRLFNACKHGEITVQKVWMSKGIVQLFLLIKNMCYELFKLIYFFVVPYDIIIGSEAYEKLCDTLNNPRLAKGIKQASSNAQTSCLEGYHSVINQFAPKMLAFSYNGMLSR